MSVSILPEMRMGELTPRLTHRPLPGSFFKKRKTLKIMQLLRSRRGSEWYDEEKLFLCIKHKSGGATVVIDSHSHS
jgi:hypothetical protein